MTSTSQTHKEILIQETEKGKSVELKETNTNTDSNWERWKVKQMKQV